MTVVFNEAQVEDVMFPHQPSIELLIARGKDHVSVLVRW